MEAVAALERDAQLMLRVREGDETSFALLLERHGAPVVNFLYRMVQNRAVSEELAQEVFLRVYRSRETYEPTAKFTTWLFRIATHLALNWIRDGKKEKRNESLSEELMEGVGAAGGRPAAQRRAGDDLRSESARDTKSDRGAAREAARRRLDAQVPGSGLFSNIRRFELHRVGGQVFTVPRVRNVAFAFGAFGMSSKE